MRCAVAYSELSDSFAAAQQVALSAQQQLAASPDLALLFTTVQHDVAALQSGLLAMLGEAVEIMIGGAVGVMTSQHYGYAGHQIGLLLFKFESESFQLHHAGPLGEGEYATGLKLGLDLSRHLPEQAAILLLYDSKSQVANRAKLNMATPLLQGIQQHYPCLQQLVGAGLIGDMAGSPMPQVLHGQTMQQQAIALCFGAGIQLDSVIMHGCEPASDYYTITKATGNLVYELDGLPVLDVISELLGHALTPEEFGFFVTLGVNQGEQWGEFDESNYMNRLCLKADVQRQALMMFEPDLEEGTQVQLMVRSMNMDYIAPRIEALFAGLQGRKPVLALYINCAGRAAAYSGIHQEDAVIVQQSVADRVPLLGFYSGVEIGQIRGQARALDWTGVFCLLSTAA